MSKGDIHLRNESGKVDPRLTVSRPSSRRKPVKDEPKVSAIKRISTSLRSLVGKR